MTTINEADAVRYGDLVVDRVYAGAVPVWPFIDSADWLLDVRNYAGGGPLLDQSPNKLHARFGLSDQAEIAPIPAGGVALVLPGTVGNYASVPGSGPLNIAGTIEITLDVTMDKWRPAISGALANKMASSSLRSWRISLEANGQVAFTFSLDGSTAVNVAAQLPVLPDGSRHILRILRYASTGVVNFYLDGAVFRTTTDVAGNLSAQPTSPVEFGTAFAGTAIPLAGMKLHSARIANSDGGAAILDARFSAQPAGTVAFTPTVGPTVTVGQSADTGNPQHLPHTGTDYLYFPGGANYASTPDPGAITGDLDLRCQFDISSIPSAAYAVFGQHTSTGATRSYLLRVESTARVALYVSLDGTSEGGASADVGLLPGKLCTLRVTRSAATGTVTFYTAPSKDGPWTQVFTAASPPGVLFNSAAPLIAGVRTVPAELSHLGRFYWGQVRNGIDGPVIAELLPANFEAPYVTALGGAGETWTITRAATGRRVAVVDRPMILLGGDDSLVIDDHPVLDFAAGQDFTVVVAYRQPSFTAAQVIFSKKNSGTGTAVGWLFRNGSTVGSEGTFTYSNGTQRGLAVPQVAGALNVLVARRRAASIALSNNGGAEVVDSAAGVTDGDFSNAIIARVAAYGGGANFGDLEFLGVAAWRRHITPAEVAKAVAYFTEP